MKESLSGRIFGRLLVATGLALTAALGVLAWDFQHSAQLVHDRGLSSAVDEIAAHLAHDANGDLIETLSDEFKAQFEDEHFFTVGLENGSAILSVPPGMTNAFHPFDPKIIDDHQYFEHNYLGENENYIGVTKRAEIDGEVYWVQLVESVPGWQNLINYSSSVFMKGAGLVLIAYFLIGALLTRATIKLAFAPVDRLAKDARAVTLQHPDIRLDAEGLPSEVVPLVETTNTLLDRLQKALLAQRRFTADAAHELLTPIAILKADVQSLDNQEKAAALLRDIDDITDIVMQLLELSELESDADVPKTRVDLVEISSAALTRLAPLAIEKNIECELAAPEAKVVVRGSAKSLQRAVGNLIENAIRHGLGATTLTVAVSRDGRVAVIDDGPGVPPDQRELIFQRFRRTPGSQASGTGLGLAIVARIVEAHHGSVSVSDGPGGRGSRFEIGLPLAARA